MLSVAAVPDIEVSDGFLQFPGLLDSSVRTCARKDRVGGIFSHGVPWLFSWTVRGPHVFVEGLVVNTSASSVLVCP